ncbi:hypothetical protein FACS1894180_5930 [Bacteroidia bacterium]|nr:hypothetical protein FACS1894180_5930 [Bacteroidia bacterium]
MISGRFCDLGLHAKNQNSITQSTKRNNNFNIKSNNAVKALADKDTIIISVVRIIFVKKLFFINILHKICQSGVEKIVLDIFT